jgi:hypothetical protein
MRNIIVAVVLGLLPSSPCATEGQALEFLSWYDGWGTHTVWGAGTIAGSYNGARVNCGRLIVPVRAIHDSHETDGQPLLRDQTSEHAKVHNLELLHSLEGKGIKCAFGQAFAAEA